MSEVLDMQTAARKWPEAFTDRSLYTSAEILEEEFRRIFAHVWLFVAHESQVPNPGDFVRKTVARQPLLVVRDESSTVHVFFNTCRHRASLVEVEKSGNRNRFACPYHGFTYSCSGDLVRVPNEDGYGVWFDKAKFGLIEVPRTEVRNGMIFVSFGATVPSLKEYFGEADELFDYATSADSEPLRVVDSYDYEIGANWKLLIDNTMDGYHVPYVHAGPIAKSGSSSSMGGTVRDLDIHGVIEWNQKKPAAQRTLNRYIAIFPNLTVNYNAGGDMYGIRQIEPLAADRMRVSMYFLRPVSSNAKATERSARSFAVTWGPGGLFGGDDAKQLEWVQEGMKAACASPVIAARALDSGKVGDYEGEQSIRGIRRGWIRYMDKTLTGLEGRA